MSHFIQETDSISIDKDSMPIELFRLISPDITSERLEPSEVVEDHFSWPALYSAWATAAKMENTEVADVAKDLLSRLEKCALKFEDAGFDLVRVPTLYAFVTENGGLLFEWMLSDFRIGFTIETNERESCWYVVTTEKMGSIRASGYTHGVNLDGMIAWLFHFLIFNI